MTTFFVKLWGFKENFSATIPYIELKFSEKTEIFVLFQYILAPSDKDKHIMVNEANNVNKDSPTYSTIEDGSLTWFDVRSFKMWKMSY